ncbi:MAG TPA: hypothetical protein LFV90_07380 [Rickettsia endosymbiont of Columbicola hoogstraali]|nr:hypothetical protein [Rickettsia endosymbiont of Columbicola hoogstraali]
MNKSRDDSEENDPCRQCRQALLRGSKNLYHVIPAEAGIQHKARKIEILVLKICYEVTENLKILDNIVLPSYALNQEQIKQIQEAKVKLIETTGIPHTLTKEDCIKEYKDLANKKLIPDSSNGYIIYLSIR